MARAPEEPDESRNPVGESTMATTAPGSTAPSIVKFEATEWTLPPLPDDLPEELRQRAEAVRRKGLAAGEGGFFASHVQMPAGQLVEPHSHDHSELMVVLEGSMTFAGGTGGDEEAGGEQAELSQFDSVVIPAGYVYGFTVGDAGISFLLIRAGKAQSTLADSA